MKDRVEGRGSRVEGRGLRVEGRGSRVERTRPALGTIRPTLRSRLARKRYACSTFPRRSRTSNAPGGGWRSMSLSGFSGRFSYGERTFKPRPEPFLAAVTII